MNKIILALTAVMIASFLMADEVADFKEVATLFKDKDYQGAAEKSAAYLETYPDSMKAATMLYINGAALTKIEDYVKAHSSFTTILDKHSDFKKYDQVLFLRATCSYKLEDYQGVLDDIEKLKSSYPDSAYLTKTEGMESQAKAQLATKEPASGEAADKDEIKETKVTKQKPARAPRGSGGKRNFSRAFITGGITLGGGIALMAASLKNGKNFDDALARANTAVVEMKPADDIKLLIEEYTEYDTKKIIYGNMSIAVFTIGGILTLLDFVVFSKVSGGVAFEPGGVRMDLAWRHEF